MLKKITLLLAIFVITGCEKTTLAYQKHKMQSDITKNRYKLYKEAYGALDKPEDDIEN